MLPLHLQFRTWRRKWFSMVQRERFPFRIRFIFRTTFFPTTRRRYRAFFVSFSSLYAAFFSAVRSFLGNRKTFCSTNGFEVVVFSPHWRFKHFFLALRSLLLVGRRMKTIQLSTPTLIVNFNFIFFPHFFSFLSRSGSWMRSRGRMWVSHSEFSIPSMTLAFRFECSGA